MQPAPPVESEEERLYQPLTILRDVSQRLLKGQIPTTQKRLEELYSHISGAMGDALEYAREKIQQSKDATLGATQEWAEGQDEATREALAEFEAEFESSQSELLSALEFAREAFFQATSFQDLQNRQGQLAMAEARLESGLQSVEAAMLRLESPELLIAYQPTAEQVPLALDRIGDALAAVNAHMSGAARSDLERALEHLRAAQTLLEAALNEKS